MLLLAYCAGLRRGELARLDLGDVDFKGGTITVRQTKFFKTRILPLPDSVMAELRAYIDARRRAGASQDPQLRRYSGTSSAVPATRRKPSPGCSSTSYAGPG